MTSGGPGWNISRWSIAHPHLVLAFYAAVLLLCLVVAPRIPRRMMPYVESPMIGIVSMMPGLSAEEMETYISKPVEERMTAIRNVRFIRSTSQDGFSIVSLEFPYGTDMKRALTDTQALMSAVQADLPVTGANLKPAWVLPVDPLNIPVLTVGLRGDRRWDPARLRQLADNAVMSQLKTVPDVYTVSTYGGWKRQMQVIVDRSRLAAYGLSILDVRNALDDYNVARPAGTLTSGATEAIVRLNALSANPADIRKTPVKAMSDGRLVTIGDVARVLDATAERRSAYHTVGHGVVKDAIGINILQNPEVGSPRVIRDVKRQLRVLERQYPGIHFEIAYDNAHFVDILVTNMLEELGMAVLLTGLVIFLFLGSGRATLISMVTLPVSLAMAILGMFPLGLTLNSSTLIGLLLSIGRLVDDAIIDIHAVEKHLRMGKDPVTATVDGITEVRLAVAASTLILILALIPLLLSGGIVQQMFAGLVWPIILGLIASFMVSLTLTAVLAARFLKPWEDSRTSPSLIRRWVTDPFQRFLRKTEAAYDRVIRWALFHRLVVVGVAMACIIIGVGFYHVIGSEMMPLADVGQAYGVLETRPGTSFARTEQIVASVERLLAAQPEVVRVSTELGAESGPAYTGTGATFFTGYSMGQVNGASMMITLTDKQERSRSIWRIIDGVQREAMRRFPGEIRRFQIKEMGSDVMASSQAPISILITGPDFNILDQLGRNVENLAAHTPGLAQAATDWTRGLPTRELRIDWRKAAAFGLSPRMISDQLYYSLGGGLTSEYFHPANLRQNTILVRYEADQRRNLEADLAGAYLTNSRGEPVPLQSLATIENRQTPSVITHDGLRRTISVLGFYRPGGPPSMDLTMTMLQKAVSEINWPPGYGIEVRGDMTQMMDSFRRLMTGLMLAILIIFLVLAAQFRGVLQPFQMILSLPLELTGVFIGLALMGQAFSTVSIMAVLILTGMDMTTAILMIDAMNRHRRAGKAEALAIRHGAVERLRPVLMTSVITIAVMLPVSVFPRTGLDAYSPLGTVVVWGLIAGTLLSLLVIPVMHSLADEAVVRFRRKNGKAGDLEGLPE